MVAALSPVPQVYVDFVASPALLPTVPADTVGTVGLASRGPINTPQYCRTLKAFLTQFGGETPSIADPTQPLSLWKAAYAMDSQGVPNKLFNRVAGATAASAYVHLSNATGRMVALHAATPGTWGNQLAYVVSAGASASVFNLIVTNPTTGESDILTGLPWANIPNLLAAINQSARLVVATVPVADSPLAAPTAVASTVSGTLPAGTYYGVMAYSNALAGGNSIPSPETVAVTLAAPGNIVWTLPAASGQTGARLYLSTTPGGETFAGQVFNGLSVTISALPASSTVTPPTRNSAIITNGDNSAIATPGSFAFPTVRASGVGVGDNGENCPSSFFIGALGTPSTGLYSFAALDPKPQQVFIAEGAVASDVTTWAAQAQIAQDNDWVACVGIARGTSLSAAVTLLTTTPVTGVKTGGNGNRIKVGYVGFNVQDSYYNQLLGYGPAGFLAGVTAVQDPNTSAGLKGLANVDSAEYDLAVGQAEQIITAGANPALTVRGVGLCFARDIMLDGSEGFKVRMDSLLKDVLQTMGVKYLQKPNKSSSRQALRMEVMGYLDGIADDGLIPANPATATAVASPTTSGTAKKTGPPPSTVSTATPTDLQYGAQCDDNNNTGQDGKALPQIIVDVLVNYFDNPVGTRFRLQTGTNVQVTINPPA